VRHLHRGIAIVSGLLATGLTIFGVVAAGVDANPSGAPYRDPLALNGYPPTSVGLSFNVHSNSPYTLTGTAAVDLATNAATATVQVPFVLGTVTFTARALQGRVFFNNANLNTATHPVWFDTRFKVPALFGGALELTKPDIALVRGFPITSVRHDAHTTTYTFEKTDVPVTPVSATHTHSTLGSERWTVTTGSQGEVVSSSLDVRTPHAYTKVVVSVLWYNHPVRVTAPPRDQWAPLPQSLNRQIRKTSVLHDFVVPNALYSLGTAGQVA